MKNVLPSAANASHISVISSFTEDIIFDEHNALVQTQQAGPAYYIREALTSEGVGFELATNDSMTVEIRVTKKGEFGRVPSEPKKRSIDSILSDWTIVSTVLDEWDLATIKTWPIHLCIDLQGFVRDGKDFGKKRSWNAVTSYADKIYCLKGTKEEVSYIPANVIENQKQKLLVVTDGSNGVDVYYKGIHNHINSVKVSNLKNTIGAGDTFFSYFISSMNRGKDPILAAKYAMAKTEQFLLNKKELQESLYA